MVSIWPEDDWNAVSRVSALVWLIVYVTFFVYAAANHGGFLFIDNANLVVHEGGHLLFGWFGEALGLWGGTVLQWMVPLLLAAYFFYQRQTTAFAFCAVLLFENFLYTATYMADARSMSLPLVTVGDPENSGHDWNRIFGSLGILQYDTRIAAVVHFLGWAGMISTAFWLAYRGWRDRNSEK